MTLENTEAPESKPEPARIIIVDDHELVRTGLKTMLGAQPHLEIIGEASDGQEAVELCQRVKPDLVLMDVRMPKMDGLAATREIKQRFPKMSVLILTVHENEDYMLEAIRAGASGYVLKDSSVGALVTAIGKVLEGEESLNRDLATKLLKQLVSQSRERREPVPDPERDSIVQSLTAREIEVLNLLTQGNSNRKIAEKLFISMGTAKNHVEHIFAKLSVSDRTQAVVRAFELGIVEPPRR